MRLIKKLSQCLGVAMKRYGLMGITLMLLLNEAYFQAQIQLTPLQSLVDLLIELKQGLQQSLQPYRKAISGWLRSQLPHMSSQAIVPALMVGDRDYLHQGYWRTFNAVGVTHLMAISGLHIGLVWGVLLWFMGQGRLGRHRAFLKQGGRLAFAYAMALSYGLLAGFTVPTQRALLMVGVVSLTLYWRRSIRAQEIWWFSLLMVLLLEPGASEQIGFWLSFGAVALLMLSVRKWEINPFGEEDEVGGMRSVWITGRARAWAFIRLQLIITFGLLPGLWVSFAAVSWVSPFVNLLAIPLISVVVPAILLAMMGQLLLMVLQPALTLLLTAVWLSAEQADRALQWCQQGIAQFLGWVSVVVDGSWQGYRLITLQGNPLLTLPEQWGSVPQGGFLVAALSVTIALMGGMPARGVWWMAALPCLMAFLLSFLNTSF